MSAANAEPGRALRVFGEETVEALALWAIDALCEPPVRIETFSTRMPKAVIEDGRAILDRAEIDWKGLKGTTGSQQHQREVESGR